MSKHLCYINNIPVTEKESKLFDMYLKYLDGKLTKEAFKNPFGSYDDFHHAENLYIKIMY